MSEPTNSTRANWARTALEEHASITRSSNEDYEDKLRDLLCNLHHLADEEGLDFKLLAERAKSIHEQEVEEEADNITNNY